MNGTVVSTTTLIDICRVGGPFTAALSGIAVLAITALTILGIIARVRGIVGRNYSWWLLRIGLGMAFFGLAGFANDAVKAYLMSNLYQMGATKLLFASICESLIKIGLTAFVAFLAVIGCLIVGPNRGVKRDASIDIERNG